jgi:hypothetical protein
VNIGVCRQSLADLQPRRTGLSVDEDFVHSYCFGHALTANPQPLAASSVRFKAAAVKECQ